MKHIIIICCLFLLCPSTSILCENADTLDDNEDVYKKNIELLSENARLRSDNYNLRTQLKNLSNQQSAANASTFIKNVISDSLNSIEQSLDPLRTYVADNFKVLITLSGNNFQSTNVALDLNSGPGPKNCAAVRPSGVYRIRIPPYRVYCDANTDGGNWTVIQRRMDGSVDFYRPWLEYKQGFGHLEGEFFIGLDNLHIMTTYEQHELIIVMEDYDRQRRYAKYTEFVIGSEQEQYSLKVLGSYSGDAGDSMNTHKSQKFSTYDQDNDPHTSNCAQVYKGGWWYNSCHHSNLNGEYGNHNFGIGINWYHYRGHKYSLKFVEMMIRPKAK